MKRRVFVNVAIGTLMFLLGIPFTFNVSFRREFKFEIYNYIFKDLSKLHSGIHLRPHLKRSQ